MTAGRHLGETALASLAAGDRAPRGTEARHLEGCPECRDALGSLRRIVGAFERSGSRAGAHAASHSSVEAALRRALAAEADVPRNARLGRRLRPGAELEAPAGVRSAAPSTCQWLFRADELDVDLQSFAERPERRRVLGQVLDEGGGVADLLVHLHHDGPPRMTVTDAGGDFTFDDVRGRDVRIVVETDGATWRLDLGPLPEQDEA